MENQQLLGDDEDLKMQEKLNQKREARRKKILENAKTRLERLNGRTTTTSPTSITTTTNDLNEEKSKHEHISGPNHIESGEFSDPEVEPDVIIPPQMLQQTEPFDMENLFSSFSSFSPETKPQQKRHIMLRSRLHIIISALIASILSFVWRDLLTTTTTTTSPLVGFSIFLPAGLCVIVELLFFREQQPLNPLINLVITMLNIRLPSQTQNILHVLSIIQSLTVDLGVFIFSFCILSCSLVCMSNRFIDLIIIK